MPVKYVSDFTFAPSPPRPTIRGYARGGHVKSGVSNDSGHSGGKGPDNTARSGAGDGDLKRSKVSQDIAASRTEKSSGVQKPAFAKGGKVATAKVPMGSKPSRNENDATSPGSFKRTPMSQGTKNSAAANSKFSAEGRNTPVATKQDGDVQRMSGYSDFKSGGSTKPAFNRLQNLGHYAHGGKVRPEKSSGTSGGGKVKAPVKSTSAGKAESRAGTPKTSPGSRVEMKGGTAKASMGGLSRGTSPKKNAAIHAKSKKPHSPKASAGLGALAGALSGQAMPSQGAGAPPGMAPGMGAPPGGPMGGMAPQAPTMGGGPPAMATGGQLKSFTHVSYK